tara:strand:- start:125 stop:715 length:591 start_codon:yes stop_codon:yes gene_type:complete
MTNFNFQKLENLKKTFRSIIIWTFLALIIRWQIIEPRWIPSGSMIPTLEIQDKILVEKVRPKIFHKLKNHFKRNTLIVFSPPENLTDAGYDKKSALIKRVIGLPGDIIEVSNGLLIINDEIQNETWINEKINYDMKAIRVPQKSLWVLGDNRNNSLDSHYWGPLPEDNIIGTAIFRYWPLNKIGPIKVTYTSKISK